MSFKFAHNWLTPLMIPLLSAGIISFEPACRNKDVYNFLDGNDGLVINTRIQVVQAKKKKILTALDKMAGKLSIKNKWSLVELIYKECQEHMLDPQLVVALIQTESSFNNNALSSAGARGLMQIRLLTAIGIAKEMGIDWNKAPSLHDPKTNIKMGTYYLAKMIQRFRRLETALTAYNMGPTAVGRLMLSKTRIPRKYSRRVLKNYRLINYTKQETL